MKPLLLRSARSLVTGALAVSLVLCVSGPRAEAALTAHYPLEAISSGTTPDSTGGAAGVINGGITTSTGILGDAFDFSGGTSEFVGIPDAGFGQNFFTASVWFNPATVAQGDPLANWTNSGPSPRTFLIRSGSELQTFLRDNSGVQIGGNTSLVPGAGSWNHAVITYDGQTLRTYLDGAASTNTPSFASPRAIGQGVAGTAAIGGRGSSEGAMVGLVDDVAFWDEQLTGDEVVGLFDVAGIGYDASQFDLLKGIHDAGTGSVGIDGLTWTFQNNLTGAAGLTGPELVLDSATGTGLVSSRVIPEPSTVLLIVGGTLALGLRRQR